MKELFITLNPVPIVVVLLIVYLIGFIVAFRFYLREFEGRMKYYSREVFSEAVCFGAGWPLVVCAVWVWRGIDYIRERKRCEGKK